MAIGSCPQRFDDLAIERSSDSLLVHNPRSDQVHVLNLAAGLVLDHCDGSQSIEQISTALVKSLPDAHNDVASIILEFADLGLIHSDAGAA